MGGKRVKLRKVPRRVVSGRLYDWTEINRMLESDDDSVTFVCKDSEQAKNAMISLRGNRACREGVICVSQSGNEVTVTRGRV